MVVIGGGIAGLAAAFYLRDEPVRVTVLEGSPRLGGKLSASDVAGVAMDEGAEALLARRPEGIELIAAAGLGADLVPAGVTSSAIYTRGAMRPLPRRQFMGVPGRHGRAGRHRGDLGRGRRAGQGRGGRRRPRAGDVSVTEYIGARLGAEVVDRLVDPLLGGVYAGRSEDLSFQATLAPLAAAARSHADADRGGRLAAAARVRRSAVGAGSGPAARQRRAGDSSEAGPGLRHAHHRARRAARGGGQGLRRRRPHQRDGPRADAARQTGWRLTIGSAADPEYLDADAVIIAIPGRARRAAAEGRRGRGGGAARRRSRTRPWPSSRWPSAPGTSPAAASSAAATSCPPWTAGR